jgi:hydroxypyruvate reductase
VPADNSDLRRLARRVFTETLADLDAGAAVRRAISLDGVSLKIFDADFDARDRRLGVYAVGLGKAAGPMARALDEILGDRLREGVLSAPPLRAPLPARWRAFEGGHPLPNAASLDSARAAFDLLRRADERSATPDGGAGKLVVFLVSGGGSAMMELPLDVRVTLEDLRATNHALVTCGAGIAEINAVRRALSAVKGGGLSSAAPRAAQVTLIVSDVGDAEGRGVASGPTFSFHEEQDAHDARSVVLRYDLASRLPASVLHSLARTRERDTLTNAAATDATATNAGALRRHFVLLDNARAVGRAAEIARGLGFEVEAAHDLSEQDVAEAAPLLVSRLLKLCERVGGDRGACVVSGGEFACPVRGGGSGGRNSETALRCALEFDARADELCALTPAPPDGGARFVALSAGTDGIDGNSPAAGAVCDETTIHRARALGLDPRDHLERSDAYTFFDALGDAITTGATDTNVRDLRILIAK